MSRRPGPAVAVQATVRAVPDKRSRWWTSRPGHLAILAGIFAIAFIVRLLPVLRGAGLGSYGRYDDGVYYTAAESLSFGHLPYRDFVLLHPPGIALALLPFTLLGRATSDPTGMTTARLTFMALGGLSAALVTVIAGRWGWTRGVVAGLLYAASAAAVFDEEATLLEPVATVLTLVAVLALYRRTPRSSVRLEVIAGVALGLACCMKIWYVAVLLAVVLVMARRRETAAAARVLVTGAITAGVVVLPFFALAPDQMWTMVVKDQLGRPPSGGRLGRIPGILGTEQVFAGAGPNVVHAATIALVVLLLIALALCLADRDTWMIGGLFIVSAAVLLASPSYFRHYGVLLAAPTALMLPIGLGRALHLVRAPTVRVVIGGCGAALVLASGIAVAMLPTGKFFPADTFAAAAPGGCITADDPAALIQMNRLTQDFRSHCEVPVDITGASYGSALPRALNTGFQNCLMEHLTRSSAFVVLRAHGDRLSTAEERLIAGHPLLASGDGVALRMGDGSQGPDIGAELAATPARIWCS